MSIGDLQAAAARAKSAAAADTAQRPTLLRQAAAFEVELHKKFAMASACLVLGALGLVLGRLTGGGYLLAIGAGAFVFMAYYVCLIAGEALGDRGTLAPAAAMWSPDILVVLATLLGLWQLSAQHHRDLPGIH
jgi:lipopolysaccharide export system permease protein